MERVSVLRDEFCECIETACEYSEADLEGGRRVREIDGKSRNESTER